MTKSKRKEKLKDLENSGFKIRFLKKGSGPCLKIGDSFSMLFSITHTHLKSKIFETEDVVEYKNFGPSRDYPIGMLLVLNAMREGDVVRAEMPSEYGVNNSGDKMSYLVVDKDIELQIMLVEIIKKEITENKNDSIKR